MRTKNILRYGLLGLVGLLAGVVVAGLAHTFGGHIPSLPAGFAGGAGALLLLGGTAVPEAGAPLMPKDSKDLEGVRGFFSGLRQQFASTATIYTGPIKSLFDDVVAKLDAALAALPKTGEPNWSLTDQLENFFYLLNSANCVANTLGLELSKVKQQMASMASIGPDAITAAVAAGTHIPKTDFETAVSAAVAARTVAGGDLVPKETVNQLCSAAKDLGLKEGRTARDGELAVEKAADALAVTRRAALTQAGIPLPEAEVEAILRADEPTFTAARTLTENRLKGFTEAGIELTPELLGKAWLPEAAFGVFQKTVGAIPSLRRSAAPEPMANGQPPANDGKKMVM